MNFTDALEEAARFAANPSPGTTQRISMHIATNQAGWVGAAQRGVTPAGAVVSYASGPVSYFAPGSFGKYGRLPARLATPSKQGLPYLFSNRNAFWPAANGGGGGFGTTGVQQPFDANSADLLGVSVSRGLLGSVEGHFTLRTWGDAKFTVPFTELGGILVGEGPAIGNAAGIETAVYTLSVEIGYQYIG